MCHPAADRLRGQAGGNHGLRTPSADYSPTGDSEPLETYGVWPSTFWPVGPALAQTVFDARELPRCGRNLLSDLTDKGITWMGDPLRQGIALFFSAYRSLAKHRNSGAK